MGRDDIQEYNLKTYNKVVNEYKRYELNLPERAILSSLKDKWHNTRMLDIGVGAGRTSYTFSAIVKEYTGIDYSSPMVLESKKKIGEEKNIHFDVCDASDLSRFYNDKFDFILFSQNGIDSVDHDTRLKILSEVRKILDVNGYFFFSTHSLHSFFSFKPKIFPFDKRKPIHSIYYAWKDIKFAMRKKRLYRNVDIDLIKKKSWAVLITGDHDFQMKVYHIKPDFQVQQLNEAGFDVVSVYDRDGKIIDPSKDNAKGMLYFLCKTL